MAMGDPSPDPEALRAAERCHCVTPGGVYSTTKGDLIRTDARIITEEYAPLRADNGRLRALWVDLEKTARELADNLRAAAIILRNLDCPDTAKAIDKLLARHDAQLRTDEAKKGE